MVRFDQIKYFEMDRSNVRQSYLRGSYVFNNSGSNVNRSFISTALISDSMAYGDDLRKSRIQNLPNYKKTNLGDNIQFIVVFQTIEIERLSNEVEVLRVKLKQSQRQLFNAQNYEVQIRQLNEKCFSLQRLREEYCDEIDKLGKICQTLYHENQTLKSKLNEMDYSLKQKFESEKQKNIQLSQQIQKWKARYQATEKSKQKQLEDLRNLMQCQRKSMIDREIRQITIRFQNQRSGLENQIRKNRQMLENRNREIEDYRQKCQKYQISIMELRNYENVIADNENKIVLLNQELLRLNDVLSRKEDELQGIRQKQFKLNQQLKEQQEWEYENKQLKSALDNRTRDLEEWKVRASRLQDQVGKSRQMIHYNQELTDKLQVSGREIERLNKVLRSKLDQIEDWKSKCQNKELQLAKFRNLENELANYESRFSMMQAENDRINSILKSRLTEIEQWRNKCSNLQNTMSNYSGVEKEKRILEDKLNLQVKNSQQMQYALQKMEKDMGTYRNYQSQHKELERQNGIMNKEIQRLNGVIKNYSNEIEDFRIRQARMEKAMNEYKNTEVELKDLNNKINLLTQEKERLNNLIRTKNDDIQALQNEKVQMHTKINHYRNYELKITESEQVTKKLNEDVLRLRRQIEGWQNKTKQAQNKGRELQNHLFVNNNQKQKLSNMIKAKSNQYDQLRSKYARLEGDNRKITELENAVNDQHNQILAYISDIEHLQKNIKDWESELEREKQVSNEFAYKIIVLSCEIQRMAVAGSQKGAINSRQYQELQQDYSKLQTKVVSKNNEIDILNNKISSLEQKVSELTRQFKKLLADAERGDQETRILVKKVQEYQDYAKRIHILGAEIDRLRAENKSFDEDARRIRLKFADGLSLEKKQQDIQLMTVLMGLEIDSLRSRIDQREINIDEMRKSILEPVRRV